VSSEAGWLVLFGTECFLAKRGVAAFGPGDGVPALNATFMKASAAVDAALLVAPVRRNENPEAIRNRTPLTDN
jgi:hypothetical protein